jgi:hypothetical protein
MTGFIVRLAAVLLFVVTLSSGCDNKNSGSTGLAPKELPKDTPQLKAGGTDPKDVLLKK